MAPSGPYDLCERAAGSVNGQNSLFFPYQVTPVTQHIPEPKGFNGEKEGVTVPEKLLSSDPSLLHLSPVR